MKPVLKVWDGNLKKGFNFTMCYSPEDDELQLSWILKKPCFWFTLQSRIIYIGTQQKFTNFIISTLLPLIPMLKSGKLWKKGLSKPTLSSVGRGKVCGRRNLWNFCVCSIYFVRDCNWRLMTNFINICAKFIILYNRVQIQTAIKITE